MRTQRIHEKLEQANMLMLADFSMNMPFYAELCRQINYYEDNHIDTCGVNMNAKGMNFYYSSEFLSKMTQKQVNFINLHELFHLIWDHPRRTISGVFEHKLSNIAQDMIINHIIWQDIAHKFIEIPKNGKGENMALFLPKEYKGKLIFEELYIWLREERRKHKEKKDKGDEGQEGQGQGTGKGNSQGQGQGKGQSQGKGKGNSSGQESGNGDTDDNGSGSSEGQDSGYGSYGQDPCSEKGTIDTYSLDKIFDDLDNGTGEYLDQHMSDDITKETRDAMVREAIDRAKVRAEQSRGTAPGNFEGTLNKLRKKKKDYLREIRRAEATALFGNMKKRTIIKPNRKGIDGVKGFRKIKNRINVILDVSGSMTGLHEAALSYIYRNDIETRVVLADTEVKTMYTATKMADVQNIMLIGFGGTVLQPAIDFLTDKKYHDSPLLILSDGMTDTLDFSEYKYPVLILSFGTSECPVSKDNGKLKQIVIDDSYEE